MTIGMWNYAVKVQDVQETADFYVKYFGAVIKAKGTVIGSKYVLIHMGETRILLMDKAPYEEELGLALPFGFLHVVFEVDDFDAHFERLRQSGVRFLSEPRVIETGFDRRKIVFFQTPEGIRTEIMQVLSSS